MQNKVIQHENGLLDFKPGFYDAGIVFQRKETHCGVSNHL